MHTSRFIIPVVMIVMVATITLLTLVPFGIPAHAATTIEFDLTKSVYDLGSDPDVKFSFTGKAVNVDDDDKRSLISVVVSKENGPRILLSGSLNSDNTFVTLPRVVSEIFKSDGQYTATAFTPTQSVKNGTTITLEFKNNVLYVPPDFELVLRDISGKTVTEGDAVSFNVNVDDSSIKGVTYKLSGIIQPGATMDANTGKFSWTPDLQKGSKTGAIYKFQVTALKFPLESTKEFVITVKDSVQNNVPAESPKTVVTNDVDDRNNKNDPSPSIHAVELRIPAPFVEDSVDPQTYVDRYNNDPLYKEWFDDNYLSDYDSIYHAVGLKDPNAVVDATVVESQQQQQLDTPLAPFVDSSVDPHTYVDRYNNDSSYKEWFDDNYKNEYSTIYAAVGLVMVPASFVEDSVDPQTYVDRYNNDHLYKEWFDDNYLSDYDSIYHAVGLVDPDVVAVDDADVVVDDNVIDDNVIDDNVIDVIPEPKVPDLPPPVIAPGAVVPAELTLQPGQEFGECGEGTELVDNYCVIIGTKPPKTNMTSASENETKDDDKGRGGGCLIATAVYGSELAPQVQLLREIRDDQLMQTHTGASFMAGFNQVYYSFSPYIADYERENQLFRDATKSLLTPLLTTLSIMEYADSESKVLAYGIGVILLNIVIYVGIPAASASWAFRYYSHAIRKNNTHDNMCKQEVDDV